MNRRRFLSIVTLGAVAINTAGFSSSGWEPEQNSDTLQTKLLRQLQNLKSPCVSDADFFGQSYLRDNPDEEDMGFLLQSIANTKDGKLSATHLREQIRWDFDNSRTVCVDGWILSRTEARLYALSFIS